MVPVDATGAGDCFNAGLIAGLLEGLALPQAAALGCAAGALSTGAPGGTASCPDMPAAARLAELARVASFALRGRGPVASQSHLHASLAGIQWVTNAYLLELPGGV